MKSIRLVVALGALSALLFATQPGATVIYTDQATFLAQVDPGYHLEQFEGVRPGNAGTVLSFSGNGFSVIGNAYGGAFNSAQFYGCCFFQNDRRLTVSHQTASFDLTFSANVTAVGGTFFMTDGSNFGSPIQNPGTMHITLADLTEVEINSGVPFTGFTSTLPILSLTVESNRFSILNNLYIGAFADARPSAVPEPGTLGLFAASLGLMFAGMRKRRPA